MITPMNYFLHMFTIGCMLYGSISAFPSRYLRFPMYVPHTLQQYAQIQQKRMALLDRLSCVQEQLAYLEELENSAGIPIQQHPDFERLSQQYATLCDLLEKNDTPFE